MRIRKVDPKTGDYVFGHGAADFHVDVPDGPALLASERMRLWLGDWYQDITDGTPYREKVLGRHTETIRDLVLRARILGSEGVTSIDAYSASLNRDTRKLEVSATVSTAYGVATLTAALGAPTGEPA